MTVSEDFTGLTGRFRGELLAHCYRMLGSAEEAEDLVQETYLRAWRSYDGFEGRSSVRTWLYRIATNVCLTAIERRGRRPLPSGLGGPAQDMEAPLVAGPEVPWLQPFPGALLAGEGGDPAAAAVSRAGIRLAFVAALQYLSARQRAMLILRDVLEWPAAQVAELLGTTATAVNSGLRRARAQLAEALPAEDELAEPAEPDRRAVLDRFAAAIQDADGSALAELLREDAALEMPPLLTWFTGRQTVAGFIAAHFLTEPGGLRLVPVTANGERAFAVYRREPGRMYHAHAVLAPTVTATGIARIVAFQDPGLFGSFGLPREYRAGSGPLLTSSRGAIVNNVSTMAVAPFPFTPAYAISKAAAFNLTQSLRALLAGQGVRVHAILTGPTDTDMTRGFDIPKARPESVACAIFDGVELGEEEIFPDPMSQTIADSWRNGAVKAMERENAAFVAAEPAAA